MPAGPPLLAHSVALALLLTTLALAVEPSQALDGYAERRSGRDARAELAAAAPLVLHVASAEQLSTGGRQLSPSSFFRSVEAARDELRSLQPLPSGGATVFLHEGTHQPFALDAIDSGRADAPIVYASAPGETATISGGVTVPASAFKPSAAGAAGVMSASLAPLGITPAMLGGMETGEGSMDFGECQHDKAELFFGGEAMVLARYPNQAADGSWRFLYADVPAGATCEAGALCPPNYWFLMKLGANATKISSWATKDAASAWLHGCE